MQKSISALYTKITNKVGDKFGMTPEKLVSSIDEFSDEAAADPIISSVKRRLAKYGVVDAEGNFVTSESGKSMKALTIKQSEELRKYINRLSDGNDPSVKRIKAGLIESLDDDVIDGAGIDAFKTARDKARARFKEFETKGLSGIADGKIVSDDVLNKAVFGAKVKDLQAFKTTLNTGTKNQTARGSQAWKDLKLQGLKKIVDESLDDGGKIHGTKFNRQLEKIGKERLETLFEPEELMKLKTIQKALEYTTIEVPESFVNYSNTASANVNNALTTILKKSRVGELMEKGGNALSKIPGVGWLPGTVARSGGKTLQEATTAGNVKRALDPESALAKIADPELVAQGGNIGGVVGNEQFNKPLKVTVKATEENYEGTEANKKREKAKKNKK